MNNKHHGFTLLELMFVVFIISVLAAIAIPNYQPYIMRAKLAEVFELSLPIKKAIAEYYAFHGVMPKDNQALALKNPELLTGSHVSSMTVDNGAIHIAVNIENQAPIIISVRPVILKSENNPVTSDYMLWLYGNCPLKNDKFQVIGTNKTTLSNNSWLSC